MISWEKENHGERGSATLQVATHRHRNHHRVLFFLLSDIPPGFFVCVYVCRGCRVYLCVGLPSTSRPFPHLLGTPTGEPLHFPSSSSSISFLVVAVVASIVRTRLGQKKKEIETSCWRTCLDVHATLILKGNNPKNKIKRRRVFLTAIIHSVCVCARASRWLNQKSCSILSSTFSFHCRPFLFFI
jgi:hypothetical protein